MSKPYEIPQDVWDEACKDCDNFFERCVRSKEIIFDRIAAASRKRPEVNTAHKNSVEA